MCWVSNKLERKKASCNIPVIKVCFHFQEEDFLRSIYYNHIYELNKVYLGKSIKAAKRPFALNYVINEGFHSYDSSTAIKIITHKDSSTGIYVMYKDLNLDVYAYSSIYPYVKAIGYIPKGTFYFKNNQGEYVSEAIVITSYKKIHYEAARGCI